MLSIYVLNMEYSFNMPTTLIKVNILCVGLFFCPCRLVVDSCVFLTADVINPHLFFKEDAVGISWWSLCSCWMLVNSACVLITVSECVLQRCVAWADVIDRLICNSSAASSLTHRLLLAFQVLIKMVQAPAPLPLNTMHICAESLKTSCKTNSWKPTAEIQNQH